MAEGQPFGPVELQALDRNASKLRMLKAKLQNDDVRSLALIVLDRVSARFEAHAEQQSHQPTPEEINQLAEALINDDEDAGLTFIQRLYASGTRLEDVYLAYLAAAARLLGSWWEEDRVSFVDVTIGTSRIYGILRVLDDLTVTPKINPAKRALFIATPDETHTLGIKMAADLFKQKGWDIDLLLGHSQEEALAKIKSAELRFVGLSAAGEHSVAELAKLVVSIRIHRPDMFILISGPTLDEMQDVVEAMSPDAVSPDVPDAIEIFEEFWSSNRKPRV